MYIHCAAKNQSAMASGYADSIDWRTLNEVLIDLIRSMTRCCFKTRLHHPVHGEIFPDVLCNNINQHPLHPKDHERPCSDLLYYGEHKFNIIQRPYKSWPENHKRVIQNYHNGQKCSQGWKKCPTKMSCKINIFGTTIFGSRRTSA